MDAQPISGLGMTRKQHILLDVPLPIPLPLGTRILIEIIPLKDPLDGLPTEPLPPEQFEEQGGDRSDFQGYPFKYSLDELE